MGNVAVKVDCTECDGTGYENYFTIVNLPAYYRPGPVKRWNAIAGRLDYLGDCSIKVDVTYNDVISQSHHLEFNGAQWSFNFLRDPGAAMGQPRLAFALTRKD